MLIGIFIIITLVQRSSFFYRIFWLVHYQSFTNTIISYIIPDYISAVKKKMLPLLLLLLVVSAGSRPQVSSEGEFGTVLFGKISYSLFGHFSLWM